MPAPRPVPEPPAFVSAQVTDARRFYLNLKPRTATDLTVVCGGWEECAPDYTIDRKTFPFPSIEFVAAGRGEIILAGKRHELSPGALFAYGPAKDDPDRFEAGFDLSGSVDRTAFGSTGGVPEVAAVLPVHIRLLMTSR